MGQFLKGFGRLGVATYFDFGLGQTIPNGNVVIVLVQSQKLISHVDVTYILVD